MSDYDQEPAPDKSLQKTGRGMITVGWIFILGVLTFVFSNWEDKQYNPNQDPLSVSESGKIEVVLKRNRFGHYVASGYINGVPVDFLVDTGATTVAIPAHIAEDIGLRFGQEHSVYTANGIGKAYRTELAEISLGDIRLTDVDANIAEGMTGDEILLGMTFLKHLEFSQMGDELTIRQYTYSPKTI